MAAEGRKKLVRSELSPGYATELITTSRYPREREIDKSWVKYLAHQMVRDRFDGDITFVMIAIMPDKQRIMINGYHTCLAAIATQKTIRMNIFELQCADMAEVDEHYAKIDRGKRRGAAAVDRAYGFNLERDAISVRMYNAAVNLVMVGFRTVGGQAGSSRAIVRDDEVMMAVKKDWHPYAIHYFHLVDSITEAQNRRIFNNAGILAVAMVIMRLHALGKDFWANAINPEITMKGEPELALANKLRSLFAAQQRGPSKSRYKPAFYAHLVSYAWNAKREGRQVETINTPTKATLNRPLFLREIKEYNGIHYYMPSVQGMDMEAELAAIEEIQLPDIDRLMGKIIDPPADA